MRSVVTLYSRPECHLCDEARAGLERLRARGPRFELEEIDIESDPLLLRRHLERIPVIEIDGEEICHLGLDLDAVAARLGTVPA